MESIYCSHHPINDIITGSFERIITMNGGLKKLLVVPALALSFFLASNDNACAQTKTNKHYTEWKDRSGYGVHPADDAAQDASADGTVCFVVYLDPASRHLSDQEAEALIKRDYSGGITIDHKFFFDRKSNDEKGVFISAYYYEDLVFVNMLDLNQLKAQTENINQYKFIEVNPDYTTSTYSYNR